ncbi:hypothetical protein P170DRAFT_467184 [Aspergillus steynii IBT 23096]|uniref:G domain-containing protein n=1 Tax=Aspergillus steynii IBT 23096 TaxID=1392250 RepID=A0A2I2FZF5_9EURO|nr:uncharacterized protein P170DRAFT_467184 [Aspergillus steynii IBT 23096]PLB46013.1 hypothetical protein P170DRAFT_467184 [Aspergillus steynii IBT 23096]
MASNANGSDGMPLEAETRIDNDHAISLLESGALKGKVIVILIIGSTGAGKTNVINLLTDRSIPVGITLEPGIEISRAILETINNQMFLFIDTPGFGHPKMSNDKDIRADRESPGMSDSFDFLVSLLEEIPPVVSFITTKWDTVAAKEVHKLVTREEELKKYWRKRFEVRVWEFPVRDEAVLRCEASCLDDLEYREPKRQELLDRIFRRYFQAKLVALEMPFWEWTKLDKAAYIGTLPLKAVAIVLGEVLKGIGRAEVRFTFSVG